MAVTLDRMQQDASSRFNWWKKKGRTRAAGWCQKILDQIFKHDKIVFQRWIFKNRNRMEVVPNSTEPDVTFGKTR